mgnify:CR=1 FL=1
MTTQSEHYQQFLALHEKPDAFVMPNVWDGLSALIFGIGSIGFITRRNILIQLMSIELMLNSVNLALIDGKFAAGEEVTVESLYAKKLVPKRAKQIKVLGTGEIKTAVKLKVHAVSETAKAKIEAAGGSVEIIGEAAA